MKRFSSPQLRTLDQAEEIQVEFAPGPVAPHQTTIWIVVDGADAYVRSVSQPPGHWHQQLAAGQCGTICADDSRLQVRGVPVTDTETQSRVSIAYLRKYAQYPQDAAWMAGSQVEATTLRLEPVA